MTDRVLELTKAWVHEVAWTGGDVCIRLSRERSDGALDLYEFRVAGPAVLSNPLPRQLELRNIEDDVAILTLVGKEATRFVKQDGHGILEFGDGVRLDARPSPEGEAWQFQGPDELLILAPIR